MRLFYLLILLTCGLGAQDWKENLIQDYPQLLMQLPESVRGNNKLQEEFEKGVQTAGPFNAPCFYSKGKLLSNNNSLQGAVFKNGLNFKIDFPVIRYRCKLDSATEVLIRTRPYKSYKIYLNGDLLSQDENSGVTYRDNELKTNPKLQKGLNEILLTSTLKGHHFPEFSMIDLSSESVKSTENYLKKFDEINFDNTEDWLGIQLALRESDHYESQVHGILEILKLDLKKFKKGQLRHAFHKGIDPHVMALVFSKVDKVKLAKFINELAYPYIKNYFTIMCIAGRGNEVADFYEIYVKERTPSSSMSFANSMYDSAELLMMQGDSESAHRIFSLFNQTSMNKNKPQRRNIEFALIESKSGTSTRPRFSSDPEVDVYVKDLDRLLNQKPSRDIYAQVYKILRSHQGKLVTREFSQVTIKSYLLLKLQQKPELMNQFSQYINERYLARINKALVDKDFKMLQLYLQETSGLANFVAAEKFLMEEFYSRGELSRSLAYAGRLLKSEEYGHEAAAYILVIESKLSIPQNLHYNIPAELQSKKVWVAGREQSVSNLMVKYRSKLKSIGDPGKLLSKIPLAPKIKINDDGRTSSYDWDKYFIARESRRLIHSQSKWFSSSPLGTQVSDDKGKNLWNSDSSIEASSVRIQSSPRTFKGTLIDQYYYSLVYNKSLESYALQKHDSSGERQWDSSFIQSHNEWEVCSIPFSKMETNIVLLVERERQAAPVFALGFIDLASGELSSVVALAKIRDPYREESQFDIFNSIVQFDNYCEDRESIYLFSASGIVVKINAFEQRIEWLRAYPHKSFNKHDGDTFDWTNQARTASPFIKVYDKKVIHFDNASMTWYALDIQSGQILWKNAIDLPTYIHSRQGGGLIFSHMNRHGQHTLKSLSLATGQVLWTLPLGNLKISGEGTVKNNKLYLPANRGFIKIDLKNRKILSQETLNLTIGRIEQAKGAFLLYAQEHAFLLDKEGDLPTQLNDFLKPRQMKTLKADGADLLSFSYDGHLPISLNDMYFKERAKVHTTTKDAYSVIEYQTELILLKEAFTIDGVYSPSQVIWNKSFKNFHIQGNHIVTYDKTSVAILDLLTLESKFSYEINQRSNLNVQIKSVRLNNKKIYVLSSDRRFQLFDLASSKRLKNFYLEADDFVVAADKILSFSANHSVKNKVYEISDQLQEIKTLSKSYHAGYDYQSNSFGMGWLSHQHLHFFDFRNLKMHQFGMGHNPHRAWKLGEKFAAVNLGELVDLETGKLKKYNYLALGNKGAVYRKDKDSFYVSDRGHQRLERFNEVINLFDDELSPNKNFKGLCREVGDKLVLCNNKMRNVYSLKSGELIARDPITGSGSDHQVLTDRSLVVVHKGKAQIYNSLKIPSVKIAFNENKVDQLFWRKVTRNFWNGTGPFTIPEVEYRLSDNPKKFHLQVRFKGHENLINELAVSLNSHRFDEGFYGEFTEKGKSIAQVMGSFTESFKHYFSADGYEYIECVFDKPELMANAYEGVISFELSLLSQGSKVGSLRFGSGYQSESTVQYISQGPLAFKCMDKSTYEKLEKLYEQAKVILADGETLSAYIRERRNIYGIKNNLKYLESLLEKHASSVQAHNILSVLFLEYLAQNSSETLSDKEIRNAYTSCKSLVDKLNIVDTERALSLFIIDFKKPRNPYVLPRKIKLSGRGQATYDLSGSLQFSAGPGRLTVPLGFFGDQLQQLENINFESSSRFKAALGKAELFINGKFIPLVGQEGQAQSGLNDNSWKNNHYSFFDFTGENRELSWYPKHGDRLRLKKIIFKKINEDYIWDEQSLMLNLTLNPLNHWRAKSMLDEYIKLRGVKQSELLSICSDILSNDAQNPYLLEAILEQYSKYMGKDLNNFQKLMSKARVALKLRRNIALDNFGETTWLELGPLKQSDDEQVEFVSPPENSFSKKTFELSDGSSISYQAYTPDKERYEGMVYLRKDFTSDSSSKAYLHFKREKNNNSYNSVRIWLNGNIVEDTVIYKNNFDPQYIKLPLRKGRNSILIKYTFQENSELKLKIGDIYGGELSYLK
ncbi:hypothetical protein PQO03_00965 [Lentisphaera profundi]|uniref:Uncharacterized protein n=1 Tax=Lentisphaera profundi TaxID=1658616 RepID=A0ABY7VUN0_9BACT|nr:hypothetical protein [Lentisphaera profundi]WDE96536.1 hypothetical protein PQO03_00965 [Lentisphaera profundi]